MAQSKTRPTRHNPDAFIQNLPNEIQRADCFELLHIMRNLTNHQAELWGENIVGFGRRIYKYESGRSGEWFVAGFSPRKTYISIYLTNYIDPSNELYATLGKFTHGKACLNIKKLEDINMKVLEEIIRVNSACK